MGDWVCVESGEGLWAEVGDLHDWVWEGSVDCGWGICLGELLVLPEQLLYGGTVVDIVVLWQIPIIAPFCGAAFGGWLYDMFLFTGESPINTEGAGLKRLISPRKEVWSNTYQSEHV
jgi:hypothetical protein